MKRLLQFHCAAAWPPFLLVAIFACVYVAFNIGIWFIWRDMTYAANYRVSQDAQAFAIIIGAAASLHALCRLARFHPVCNFSYASWLALSPWTATKPLPLGPIHPVWQDIAVIAILVALARWHAHIDPALPLFAFGLTYLIGLTLLLVATRTWPSFFAMGFLWPSLALTNGKSLPVALIFAVMILVLWHGTCKSLWGFPWRQENRTHPGLAKAPNPKSMGQVEIRIEDVNAMGTSSTVGWSFAQLSPKARFKSVSTSTGLWVSLLIGWWAYCLIVGSGMESAPGMILVFGLFGALVRVGIYWGGLAPSFSFRSRLVSGRLIVPGFDQIFIAPLMAVAVAVVGGVVIRRSGSLYPEAHSVFITLILFVLLAGGPTMRNWVLTGEHRFLPRFASGANRQAFRPV
jgi:hypothetical protein